jgi:hypothetical protein
MPEDRALRVSTFKKLFGPQPHDREGQLDLFASLNVETQDGDAAATDHAPLIAGAASRRAGLEAGVDPEDGLTAKRRDRDRHVTTLDSTSDQSRRDYP